MGLSTTLLNMRAAKGAANTAAAASDRAADLTAQTARESVAEQRRQYDLTRSDLMPWMESGKRALGTLDQTATGDMSAFYASPDYNFRRSEGTRDIGSSFAARGGAASGNALKALAEFNQNLARGEFGDWWNRTASRANVGQTAVNSAGQFGANAVNNISNINANAAGNIGNAWQNSAAARASGVMGAQNAFNQGRANTMQWAGKIFGWGG